MPLRTIKKETNETLTLEWALHVKNYQLVLCKSICFGCQICTLACPKEAISTTKPLKLLGQKTQKARVDIDLSKCNFCGICDAACPYGALRLTIDGKHTLPAIEKLTFPVLTRDIESDPNKFPENPKEVEDACPLGLIKITCATAVKPVSIERGTCVTIDKDHCPTCTVCQARLPKGAIRVHKLINGKLAVNPTRCPVGCTDCLDACPITGALYISKQDNKVHVNETFCVYCGACKLACPVSEALEIKRTTITHAPVRSGAWNKALERMTSSVDLTKELKTKGSVKAREAVRKRTTLEETKAA